jgi:hypothetical protein
LLKSGPRKPAAGWREKMSWCGNRKGGDACTFSAMLRRLGDEHKFSVNSGDFYCDLKDAHWYRVQFDHAVMYKGKLRLIEFDDEDYDGKNHPRRKEKIHACGVSNVPFRIFYSRDLWSGDIEEQILSFVFTNVVGKQYVIPSRTSWDFVERNLSWQMRRHYDKGKRVYGWARKYILVANELRLNPN